MLTVPVNSFSLTGYGILRPLISRSANFLAEVGDFNCVVMIVNSSPPMRERMSSLRVNEERCPEKVLSKLSPWICPKVSLMALKLSMSIKTPAPEKQNSRFVYMYMPCRCDCKTNEIARPL